MKRGGETEREREEDGGERWSGGRARGGRGRASQKQRCERK